MKFRYSAPAIMISAVSNDISHRMVVFIALGLGFVAIAAA